MNASLRGVQRAPRTTLLVLILVIGVPLSEAPASWRSDADASWGVQVSSRVYNQLLASPTGRRARARWEPWLGGLTRLFFERVGFGSRGRLVRDDRLTVDLELPFGSPVEETDRLARRFEMLARQTPDVDAVITRLEGSSGELEVRFQRVGPAAFDLRQRLVAEAVGVAGVEVGVAGLLPLGFRSGLGGESASFEIEARGPSWDRLETLVDELARRLRSAPRVARVDVHGGWKRGPGTPRTLRLGSAESARPGVPGRWLEQIEPLLERRLPDLWLVTDHGPLPVRIAPAGAAWSLQRLLARPMAARDGRRRALGRVATVTEVAEPARIERVDQRYVRRIEIFYSGPDRLGRTTVDGVLDTQVVPAGYSLERREVEFFTARNRRQLGLLLAAALALIVLATAALFESWRMALASLAALPIAALGVAAAFLVTDAPFAEGAFLGLVLLVGIAVNNAILLLYRFRQLQARRPTTCARRLYRLAVRQRLAPMWATTLTSVACLAPVAVDPASNPFWLSIAVTVAGGLLLATVLLPYTLAALLACTSLGHVVPPQVRGFRNRDRKTSR